MNVSFINNDSVRGIIRLEIVKSDYADSVEKACAACVRKLICRASVKEWCLWVW